MSYFRKPGAGLDEQVRPGHEPDELLLHEHEHDGDGDGAVDSMPRATFGELAGRVGRWFQGLDPETTGDETAEYDMLSEPVPDDDEPPPSGPEPRFALTRYGYDQGEVDRRLAELEAELAARDRRLADRERELAELREAQTPPPSITEEIERIGEQTASILVVAHDQAHETTRRAEEQAERCITDAAANAVSITAEAKERLRELDDETDSVWRERERLLEDSRAVSVALASLVDDAQGRFPADAERGSVAGPAGRGA